MPTGNTTTGALADSLPTMIASARLIREYEGVMPQLVDRQTLAEGTGLDWNEISLAQLVASAVTESTVLDNPQQMADTLLTSTPTVAGIETLVNDRVARRISKIVYQKIGALAQNAIQRKKDEDGLTVLDSGNTTSSPGGGTTLTSGHIASAVANIQGNTTEPGPAPYRAVLHSFQIKDLYDEAVSGLGTYPVPEGFTARVFSEGFSGMISGAGVFRDDNITISGTNAKGGVFARDAIILVQGHSPRVETKRRPEVGGGATSLYHYDEYAYGFRSSTNWLAEIQSDAAAPSS